MLKYIIHKLDVIITPPPKNIFEEIFGENAFLVLLLIVLAVLCVTALAVFFGIRAYIKKNRGEESKPYETEDRPTTKWVNLFWLFLYYL